MFKYTHLFLHFILLRSEKSCKFVNVLELEIFPKDVIFPFYLSFTIPNTSCINKSPLYRHRERGSGSINFLRRQEDLKGKKKDTKDTRLMRYAIEQKKKKRKKQKEERLYTSLGNKSTVPWQMVDPWSIYPVRGGHSNYWKRIFADELNSSREVESKWVSIFRYFDLHHVRTSFATGRRENRFFKRMNMTFTCIFCKFTLLVLADINNWVAGIWS